MSKKEKVLWGFTKDPSYWYKEEKYKDLFFDLGGCRDGYKGIFFSLEPDPSRGGQYNFYYQAEEGMSESSLLFVFGWYINIETMDVYADCVISGSMVVIFNFQDFMGSVFPNKPSKRVIASSLQRYKLTGDLRGYYDSLLNSNEESVYASKSLTAQYLTIKKKSEVGDLNDMYQYFPEYMVKTYIELEGLLKTIAYNNSDWVAVAPKTVDGAVSKQEFFNEFRRGLSRSYGAGFLDWFMVRQGSDLDDELFLYHLSANQALHFDSKIADFRNLQTMNTMEVLETLKKGHEVIYSSDTKKFVEDMGIDKLVGKEEQKKVESILKGLTKWINKPGTPFYTDTLETLPKRIELYNDQDYSGKKTQSALMHNINSKDMVLFVKMVKYIEEVV